MGECTLYDLYVKLREAVPGCQFSCAEPISYINTLCDNPQKKYIFAYKSIAGNRAVLKPDISSDLIDKKEPNLNLTGNPLEDDCSMDLIEDNSNGVEVSESSWTKKEETFSCMTVDDARSILLHAAFHQPSCKSGSVWVLCDGKDYDKTILVEDEIVVNWNCRGAVYFKDFTTFAKIDITPLMAKHFSYLTGCQKLNTTIQSFFNIKPNMTLKFSQSTTSQSLLLNSYKKADIVLYQTVKIGAFSVAQVFWQQLMIICDIRDDILKYKSHEARFNLTYSYGGYSDVKLSVITQQIEQILLDVAPCSFDESTETNVITTVLEKAKSRNHIDITDRLWTVLTDCTSYSDLKAAFNHIFKFAAQCNIVNMPTNQNHLAVLIREISQQRIAIPSLAATEPLELLLEIGLEKVAKDYEYIFSESKICGGNELNINDKEETTKNANDVSMNVRKTLVKTAAGPQSNYRQTLMKRNGNTDDTTAPSVDAGFHNSKFDRQDVDRRLAKLAQIHLILEHLLLIQIHLSMESIHQSIAIQQLQKPAKPFDIVKSMGEDKREIPIVNDKILSKIENMDPDALAIVMTSENKFKRIRNMFFYSVASIFPTNIYPEMEMCDEELTKVKQYCGLHYLRIESRSG